jgi:hypothetical protein
VNLEFTIAQLNALTVDHVATALRVQVRLLLCYLMKVIIVGEQNAFPFYAARYCACYNQTTWKAGLRCRATVWVLSANVDQGSYKIRVTYRGKPLPNGIPGPGSDGPHERRILKDALFGS